jgi:hypothetical protein
MTDWTGGPEREYVNEMEDVVMLSNKDNNRCARCGELKKWCRC